MERLPALVSTQWLAAQLGAPDLLVFDATQYLPNEPQDGRTLYKAAHIPGAAFWDHHAVSDVDTDLPTMVPPLARLSMATAAMGVGPQKRVVVYDQRHVTGAARAWWLLGLFGFDNVAVLDGGLAKWQAEGRPVEEGLHSHAPSAPYPFSVRPERLRSAEAVRDNIDTQAELLLDARLAGRFHGADPEPRKTMRVGHIPGSVNLPYDVLLAPDGTLLPPAQLHRIFTALGAGESRDVISSCGSGLTATIITLARVVAGLPAGAVYDGSWAEWGGRADLPIIAGGPLPASPAVEAAVIAAGPAGHGGGAAFR
ncbi:thiosulfate/3-mercaptopyruvate sulfurtransferase [Ketogulonicigenium robustum]|uniref:Thiosulfate/3-mercaptopyruvate sulfurtransferase n=1 Tax=Ketogulonicigenium robustum TaxID=92947 RepID=A0A1W6P1W1_9RHOB|nr:sulfurtransferase [Ketogulonicigenium robustum]ARO15498.1 thiosulfate/3-mercaptopyruvate sulfurtransferase [Ketogulonicigenium robustum]